MSKEIFVEIKCYDGQYLISNKGNVKTRNGYNSQGLLTSSGYAWKWGGNND